jgi:hypothetical protein
MSSTHSDVHPARPVRSYLAGHRRLVMGAIAALIAAAVLVTVLTHSGTATASRNPTAHTSASARAAGSSTGPPAGSIVTAVTPCPIPSAQVAGAGAVPAVPARTALTSALPPGAVLFGTGEPGGPVVYEVAPAGASCSAAFGGADGGFGITITGSGSSAPLLNFDFDAGGAVSNAELACPYIPAVAAADVTSGFGTCPAHPVAESVHQLEGSDATDVAALVTVPVGTVDPQLAGPDASNVPVIALIVAGLQSGPAAVSGAQQASCALPDAQHSLCIAALQLFARQSMLAAEPSAENQIITALAQQ